MRENRTIGAALVVVLAVGWVVGAVTQRGIVEGTGYMDVSPALLILGVALCGGAGAAARFLVPSRRLRSGAFGGVAMVAALVLGYWGLVLIYADRFVGGDSGETWQSLLLESWFWVAVPLAIGAALGALGWLIADAAIGLAARSRSATR